MPQSTDTLNEAAQAFFDGQRTKSDNTTGYEFLLEEWCDVFSVSVAQWDPLIRPEGLYHSFPLDPVTGQISGPLEFSVRETEIFEDRMWPLDGWLELMAWVCNIVEASPEDVATVTTRITELVTIEEAQRAAVRAIAPDNIFVHDLSSPYARGAEAAGADPDMATEVGARAAIKYAGTPLSDRVGGFFLGAMTYFGGDYNG